MCRRYPSRRRAEAQQLAQARPCGYGMSFSSGTLAAVSTSSIEENDRGRSQRPCASRRRCLQSVPVPMGSDEALPLGVQTDCDDGVEAPNGSTAVSDDRAESCSHGRIAFVLAVLADPACPRSGRSTRRRVGAVAEGIHRPRIVGMAKAGAPEPLIRHPLLCGLSRRFRANGARFLHR